MFRTVNMLCCMLVLHWQHVCHASQDPCSGCAVQMEQARSGFAFVGTAPPPPSMQELYTVAKLLADVVIPSEYGLDGQGKVNIGSKVRAPQRHTLWQCCGACKCRGAKCAAGGGVARAAATATDVMGCHNFFCTKRTEGACYTCHLTWQGLIPSTAGCCAWATPTRSGKHITLATPPRISPTSCCTS